MKYIPEEEIISLFNKMNASDLQYILIRNINYELPQKLKMGKDIDLLVNYEDKNSILDFFLNNKFKEIPHPHRNDIYLYGVNKYLFLKNECGIVIDLNFQLAVRSLDAGQWIPLDQEIQKSVWDCKRFVQLKNNFGYWSLDYEDEFVFLISRSIFDKKEFQTGYIDRINELLSLIDQDRVFLKLKKIFFNYTPHLLEQIKNRDYLNIFGNYLKFSDY